MRLSWGESSSPEANELMVILPWNNDELAAPATQETCKSDPSLMSPVKSSSTSSSECDVAQCAEAMKLHLTLPTVSLTGICKAPDPVNVDQHAVVVCGDGERVHDQAQESDMQFEMEQDWNVEMQMKESNSSSKGHGQNLQAGVAGEAGHREVIDGDERQELTEACDDFFNRKHIMPLLRSGKKWKLYVHKDSVDDDALEGKDRLVRTVTVCMAGISDEAYIRDILQDLQAIVRQGEIGCWFYGSSAYIDSY